MMSPCHLWVRLHVLGSPITLSNQLTDIHSFSSLSYEGCKASSQASSPCSVIYSFLLQIRVTSPSLKFIQ